jgi:hypothetical protein
MEYNIEQIKNTVARMGKRTWNKFAEALIEFESIRLQSAYPVNDIPLQGYIRDEEDEILIHEELLLVNFFPFQIIKNLQNANLETPELTESLSKLYNKAGVFFTNDGKGRSGYYDMTIFHNFPSTSEFMKKKYEEIIRKYLHIQKKITLIDIDFAFNYPFLRPSWEQSYGQKAFEYISKSDISDSNIEGLAFEISNGKIIISPFCNECILSAGITKKSKIPLEPVYLKIHDKKDYKTFTCDFPDNVAKERELQEKLINNITSLMIENYEHIDVQIWLKFPELDKYKKYKRFNVLLRNSVINDEDLFDLALPKSIDNVYEGFEDLIKGYEYIIQETVSALKQLKKCDTKPIHDKIKEMLSQEGIENCEPCVRLVLGKNPQIKKETWKWILSNNEDNLNILSYDKLINEMKNRIDDRSKLLEVK